DVLRERRSVRRHLAALVLLYVSIGLVLLPWEARDYHVFGRPVFVSTNGGVNLLIGNGAGATGSYTERPLSALRGPGMSNEAGRGLRGLRCLVRRTPLPPGLGAVLLQVAYATAIACVVFGVSRYHFPLMPFAAMGAASALVAAAVQMRRSLCVLVPALRLYGI